MGGHLDSWDVGQGAHDDGAGCAMTMEALTVLRRLGLRPRRTIRVVLWTNEENGLRGAKQYALDHAGELSRHVAAIEADTGGFAPLGYRVDHADPARRKAALFGMEAIAPLLARLGATRMTASFSGADISPLKAAGVPLLGHDVDMSRYFDIHHTHADTVDKVDPVDLQKNAAVLAVTAYVLADMPGRLDDLRPPAP